MDLNLSQQYELQDLIFDARFHPSSDSELIVAASIAGDIYFLEDGTTKRKLKKHHKGSSIRRVRFFDDGRMLTIAKTVKVHDIESNQTFHTFKRNDSNKGSFYSVKSFGANIVSAGDDDGGVFVWDTRSPEKPVFTSSDCEQYISDIDGKFESRRIMLCTSGEGTLTAYDLRANKMVEPQSELFEAGFQCIKYVNTMKKVVIGGEDGAIYIFNNNEWAHTSGKFAIASDQHNRGKCSIDCLDVLHDNSTFLLGCSDGRMRWSTIWPHQVLGEKILCNKNSIESIHVEPNETRQKIVISGGKYVDVMSYDEKSEDNKSEDESTGQSINSSDSEVESVKSQKQKTTDPPASDRDGDPAHIGTRNTTEQPSSAENYDSSSDHSDGKERESGNKKFKGQDKQNLFDDYLNLF